VPQANIEIAQASVPQANIEIAQASMLQANIEIAQVYLCIYEEYVPELISISKICK
jgi:hypothetical protein